MTQTVWQQIQNHIIWRSLTQTILLLQNDVIRCAQQVEQLESHLASRLEQLQATVQSKTAVPTAQVYVSSSLVDTSDRTGLQVVNVLRWLPPNSPNLG